MPEIFIGLGPRGDVSEKFLRDRISEITDEFFLRVVSKGAIGFCEVVDDDVMHRIIHRLNGMKVGCSTITARVDNYNNTRSAPRHPVDRPFRGNEVECNDIRRKRNRSESIRSTSSGYYRSDDYPPRSGLSNGVQVRESPPRVQSIHGKDETIEEFIVNINRVPEEEWDLTNLKISTVLKSVPLGDHIDPQSVPGVGLFLALTKEAQCEMISQLFMNGISIEYVRRQISLDPRVISAKMYAGFKALLVHKVSDWLGSDAYIKDRLIDIPENAMRKLDSVTRSAYDSHSSQ
eukprot:Tbor_TRINITY_DN113_c0_g1::TRINITY_DN113_c0_g1_i1::g.12013::m.12013